jgi:hypothetical protein
MGPLMSQAIVAPKIRFKIEPRDIPAEKAARRLHLSLDEFRTKLPELVKRGFPPADPTTGMFYLPAIDQWMARRFDQSACDNSTNNRDIISSRIKSL